MADPSNLPAQRLRLSDTKRALLEQRLRGKTAGGPSEGLPPSGFAGCLQPRPAELHDPFPLTDVQQAYWIGRNGGFLLGNVSAHVYMEVESRELDPGRLTEAVRRVVGRHPMLRAVVLPNGTQHILPQVPPYQIPLLDLRDRGPAQVAAECDAVRQRMSHQIHDTSQWPLFEVRVSRLPGRERLHFSFDLLVCDAWSLQIFFRDLAAFYKHPDACLPPLDISFRDYVVCDAVRKVAAGTYSDEQWTRWLEELPPAPDLPLAVSPDTLSAPRFSRLSSGLESGIWQALKGRAAKAGLTPSALLLTAFADVLRMWSKNPRFTVNLTLFQRIPVHPQVHELIGDFTATLLLAFNDPRPTFRDRAADLHRQLLEGLEHPVSGVQALRRLARIKGTAAAQMPVVFTSALHLGGERAPGAFAAPGEVVYSISQTPQVWLDHQVSEQDGALLFNWDAVVDLFPAGMLCKMFGAYCEWLQRLAASATAWDSPSEGPSVPADEISVRQEVNAAAAPEPSELLTDRAVAQAAIRPAQTAIVTSSGRMSYAGLERRVRGAAKKLRQLGARPNGLVAVAMEKGWEQAVAALGVIRSGAAYVPLDPSLPRERFQRMLRQSEADIVVTTRSLAAQAGWPAGVRVLPIGEDGPLDDPEALPARQSPDDLAYVIYTSGSTGEPKGVMIDHRAAMNTIADVNRRFAVGPSDRVLALSSLSFDLSVWDLFGILGAGGTVVLPEPEAARDPVRWLEWLHQEQVTVWNSVPALMEMLVEAAEGSGRPLPSSLRLVLLSGDWIPVSLPERIGALAPQAAIYSLGGATEASIWSIAHEIGTVGAEWKSIPYGRPLANQQFHVLNQARQPCPDWVAGELYIGGAGLARGYWQDPERTAERFVEHAEYGRLYRTGDLGRYRPGGVIEFLGRDDAQVKIQGYRVELGEVEAALLRHPGVREAVAIATSDGAGHRHLVAFIVAGKGARTGLFREERSDPAAVEVWWRKLAEAAGERSLHLPVEMDAAIAATAQAERLSSACMRRALADMGAFRGVGDAFTFEELAALTGAAGRHWKLLRQWLRALVEDGYLAADGGRFTCVESFAAADSASLWEEAERFAAWNESGSGLLEYLHRSVSNLPAIFRGEVDPLEVLFSGGAARTAENIYELNFAARYFNGIAAEAVGAVANTWAEAQPMRVIELGAGVGASTSALLPRFPSGRTSYTYTDLSAYFLENAKKKFAAYPWLEYGLLDINEDPETQGYPAHSFDIVVANQVFHDARDLRTALRHARALLAPGGLLLMVESTHFSRLQMISVGFLEGFSEYSDERLENGSPLLPLNRWRSLLSESGYDPIAAFPEAGSRGAALAQHVFAAIAPGSAYRFQESELAAFLREILPAYMVPSRFVHLDSLPLTANGKIDRKALRPPGRARGDAPGNATAPRTPAEAVLVEVWSQVLGLERVGIHSNFFEIGGDSLLAIQIVNRAAQRGVRLRPQQIFEHQTISALAAVARDPADEEPTAAAPVEVELTGAELDSIASELEGGF